MAAAETCTTAPTLPLQSKIGSAAHDRDELRERLASVCHPRPQIRAPIWHQIECPHCGVRIPAAISASSYDATTLADSRRPGTHTLLTRARCGSSCISPGTAGNRPTSHPGTAPAQREAVVTHPDPDQGTIGPIHVHRRLSSATLRRGPRYAMQLSIPVPTLQPIRIKVTHLDRVVRCSLLLGASYISVLSLF